MNATHYMNRHIHTNPSIQSDSKKIQIFHVSEIALWRSTLKEQASNDKPEMGRESERDI